MKKTALAIFYLFILSAAPVVATAGGWKLNGELSEKGDFNSNSTLAVFSPGWVFSPIETLNVDLAYLAHDSQFDLSGGVFARNFWGPGTSVTQDVLSPSVKARWQKFGPRTSLDMSASYSYEKVAFVDSLLLDTCLPITGSHLVDCGGDIVDPVRFLDRGARNSFGANFDLAQKLDARDTLSWSNAFAGKFTTTNLGNSYETASTALSWNRLLTRRDTGNLTLGIDYLNVEDAAQFDRFAYSLTGSIKHNVNNNLSVHATGTLKLAESYQNSLLLPGNPRFNNGLWSGLFRVGMDYAIDPVTNLQVNGLVGSDEQIGQDFFNQYSINLSATRQVSDREAISLNSTVGFFDIPSASTGRQTAFRLIVSPTYSVQLIPHWKMAAFYVFSYRNSQEGTATSHEAALSITHDFVLNP